MEDLDEIEQIENLLVRCSSMIFCSNVQPYQILKDVLDRICWVALGKEFCSSETLTDQLSSLYYRFKVSTGLQKKIQQFRLRLFDVLNEQEIDVTRFIYEDLKLLSQLIDVVLKGKVNDEKSEVTEITDRGVILNLPKNIKRLRVIYHAQDSEYLYVDPMDFVSVDLLRVKYNVEDLNIEFEETCKNLWDGAQLNLLFVSVDVDGVLNPGFIVLEPDYLLDISSLAECYKPYGAHPLNYILGKLTPIANSIPILLGNIVNLFLDEWIYSEKNPDYITCMLKAFKLYPLELASCKDLHNAALEMEFSRNCKMHFEHIGRLLRNEFSDVTYGLNRYDAVLEPSYICEALGLQGRLDYMQQDYSALIEMKSGKADEFTLRRSGGILPYENHRIQMLLYMAVLQFFSETSSPVISYLLYTKYPKLCPSAPSWDAIKTAINLRNQIVAHEFNIQRANDVNFTKELFEFIVPEKLKTIEVGEKFWVKYLLPPIKGFRERLSSLSQLEKKYFFRLYNFITKELYLSKAGTLDYGRFYGAASLWLSPFMEKVDRGEILYDLEILSNHASDARKAFVTLKRPEKVVSLDNKNESLPNFRLGDAVVLYVRNHSTDNVTNQRVFKGNICELSSTALTIRLRASQRNKNVLPEDSRYAIEPDMMDVGFRNMFLGLHFFLSGSQDRRDLLLNRRLPIMSTTYKKEIKQAEDDFERLALKALAAEDYFLVVGPPGTGKTSRALRCMVEKFYDDKFNQILLMAYTNRAVDEICKMLDLIEPEIDYIRIGSELSCGEKYRVRLIENQLENCKNRKEVLSKIKSCRVFIGTVASISGKKELFDLKQFDVALIDEASQILESQLLGILMASDKKGRNAVGKFIMIGDHKQLPAIVLQSDEESEVVEKNLRDVGIKNLRDSLFERLYLNAPKEVVDKLCKQGRMHPEIASFPNKAFYDGMLESLNLPHQVDPIVVESEQSMDSILSKRLVFIPSKAEGFANSCKVNSHEAEIVTQLVKEIYMSNKEQFNPHQTVGIITPFRSQIALLKNSIARLNIIVLNEIVIDTVERFQGSERDIIIYSFCVNNLFQLKMLPNLMQENGVWVDRKLNVVLTRARKQLFITGVDPILKQNNIYSQLIDFINQ